MTLIPKKREQLEVFWLTGEVAALESVYFSMVQSVPANEKRAFKCVPTNRREGRSLKVQRAKEDVGNSRDN